MKTAEYKIDHYDVTEYTDEYRIIEGLTYWEDVNHFGAIYLTQEMYDKYDLDRCPCCETVEECYGEYDEDYMPGRQYTHVISIDHCAGVTPLGVEYKKPVASALIWMQLNVLKVNSHVRLKVLKKKFGLHITTTLARSSLRNVHLKRLGT